MYKTSYHQLYQYTRFQKVYTVYLKCLELYFIIIHIKLESEETNINKF